MFKNYSQNVYMKRSEACILSLEKKNCQNFDNQNLFVLGLFPIYPFID